MFIGNIKHDAIITKIKMSCISIGPHSRIFLVVHRFPQPERRSEIEQRF